MRATEFEAFAGRAAHDVRNPVAAAQMALDLVAARAAADAHGRELVDRARRNLQRTQTIIDGLLQFARAGARPLPDAAEDVASIVADAAASFRPAAEQAHIEVQLEPLPTCTVACSAGVLMSLVSNLVQNAIKYMGNAPRRRVTVRAFDVGGTVRIEVEDTGPGLPPGEVEELFKPFVRGPTQVQGGIGLGLATVRRLAETHGGRAGARAGAGDGAIFWFELPTARTTRAGP
ncbi:MAG TPA: HAMP domain-containing sensor histidine kinase [Anaeromyxobacteraceae bacterium]|nr:HAMP domain-containing sensor histidine kinase [Anaeromyxobacteraceae bacterium]